MNSWSETLRTFGVIAAELVVLFLAISFVVALVQRRIGPDRLQSWLGGTRYVGVLKGTALGAITPFCSCSTIPMLVGFLNAGVPFATAAAFLLSSPLINPVIVGAIWILFGGSIALGYLAVVLPTILVLSLVWDRGQLERFVRRVRAVGGPAAEVTAWRGIRAEAPDAWQQTTTDVRPLIVPMLLGVSVGAIIYGAVPQHLLVDIAGPGSRFAIPLAALIGVPLYVRTEAALPIGLALTTAGVGVGPVFALIITGAGASIPEVSMLAGLFRPPLVVAFVASIFAVAITGGVVIPMFL